MEPKDKRMSDINKLVTCINVQADEPFKESIRHFSASILSSFLGQNSNSQEDPNFWKNKIMGRVQQNYDTRSVLQCQEACERTLNNNSIKRKSQILRMLYKLSDHVANSSQNFDSLLNQSTNLSHKKALNQTQLPAQNISTVTTNQNQSYLSQKPTFMAEQLKMVRYRGSLEQGISEGNILKEITFRLQNVRSELIITDDKGASALKNVIEVNDTVRRMVRELCEIGWLYSKITESVEEGGAVSKALKEAIIQEMSEYYRWIAIIENMIKSEELTLRKLVLWSYQPFEKLKWMSIVLQAAKPFHGCQIISIINSYRPQGSNSINQLLNRLLNHLLQPLFQYIYNWVYRGELSDTEGQFFIYQKNTKNSNKNIHGNQWDEWQNKFMIMERNIPNLLDYRSAVDIFNAGKTLYFLKNHCKSDYKLDVPFFDVKSALNDKLYESTSILSPEFKGWLHQVSKKTNSYLVNVLFEKFYLKEHLNAMKMFYLIGKGDFIQSLMESLKEELTRPKHQIHEINLDGFVTQALKESFPKLTNDQNSKIKTQKSIRSESKDNIKSQIIKRLYAKKVENGSDGWDIFNFEYVVDDPISTVISPHIIRSYQKIFFFLWKVKRIEQSLKQLWVSSAKDFHHGAKLPILHQCHLLRQSMCHFVNNLYGYIMISIESAWDNFMKKFEQAGSLDEILEFQEKLIEEILEITLNTQKSKQPNICLNTIFSVILRFSDTHKNLSRVYLDYYERKREYENRMNLIRKGLDFDEDELDAPVFKSQGLQGDIYETSKLYKDAFQRFYDLIKKQQESRVNALCFRLDFNSFYSQQQQYKL